MPVEPGMNLPFDFRVFYFYRNSVARAEPEKSPTFAEGAYRLTRAGASRSQKE